MKFLAGVGHGPGTTRIKFGDDLDHRPDPGVRSGSRSGSGKNCHNSIGRVSNVTLCPQVSNISLELL